MTQGKTQKLGTRIRKYCAFGQDRHIAIPKVAKIVHVAEQHSRVTVWCEVPAATEECAMPWTLLQVVGTGWCVPENHFYVGTAFVGEYVWHVYAPLKGDQNDG